jgi:hypothetical protein
VGDGLGDAVGEEEAGELGDGTRLAAPGVSDGAGWVAFTVVAVADKPCEVST